jgi:hypothetical protein
VTGDDENSTFTRAFRAVLLVAFAIVMLGGPFVNQVVLDYPRRGLPAWRMFGTKSLGTCQTEFRLRATDGSETRLDRYALLDEGRYTSKNEFRRLKNKFEAEAVGARLCDALRDHTTDVDVRMHRRCADLKKGWNVTARGEVNVCTLPTSSAPAPRERARGQ